MDSNGTARYGIFSIVLALFLAMVTVVGTSPAQAGGETDGRAHDPGFLAWPRNLQSPCATGDWWGGRTWLEDRGLALYFDYYGEVFWNTRGGIRNTDGGVYAGLFGLAVEFSTESAGLWKGGYLFFLLQSKHGEGITQEYVGDFQVLSNMDALDFTQVSELWYRQPFLDDRIRIKVGKQEANMDFAWVEHGGEFINSSAGFSPTIPLPSYPDQDLGVVLGTTPLPWFSMNLGVYNGDPDGSRLLGCLFLEPDLQYIINPGGTTNPDALAVGLRFGVSL